MRLCAIIKLSIIYQSAPENTTPPDAEDTEEIYMICSDLTNGKRRTFARFITALLAILMICGVLCACSNP